MGFLCKVGMGRGDVWVPREAACVPALAWEPGNVPHYFTLSCMLLPNDQSASGQ